MADCLDVLILVDFAVGLVTNVLDCLVEVAGLEDGVTFLQTGLAARASASVYVTGTHPGSSGTQAET